MKQFGVLHVRRAIFREGESKKAPSDGNSSIYCENVSPHVCTPRGRLNHLTFDPTNATQ
jgi:hypothetical protein